MHAFRMTLALSVCSLIACGSSEESSPGDDTDAGANPADLMPLGTGSGATCPPNSTLTYDNFGEAFFASYCTQCHASTLTGDARHLAPEGHDFDTLEGVRAWPHHIDQYAAAGPTSTNTRMPEIPNAQGAFPSQEERTKLGEWLACGAP